MLLRLLPALFLLACTDDKVGETGDTEPVVDADADGSPASEDCDDENAAVNPSATELCNEVDDDCDGGVDEAASDMATWYGDADGDTHGGTLSIEACSAPTGFVAVEGDCDDGDASAYPGAEESCSDTVDLNCDGSVGYADEDEDGVPACEDCDDTDATALPGGVELCDAVDNDCNGTADDDALDMSTWYADTDADGYGDDAATTMSCAQPAATASMGGDCDDADAMYYPGATEDCSIDADYNCDGSTGGDDVDADGTQACDDCNDADATAYPGAVEACDGDDEDCDGEVDEAGATGESAWYADTDVDGYGDPSMTVLACDAMAGYVADATDCDDTEGSVNPGADEVCDAADVDEDCDGASDDDDRSVDLASATTYYLDFDGDGFGGASFTTQACAAPANYAATNDDCDDTRATVNPDGAEVCDADDRDEDCDGKTDDDDSSATGQSMFYMDVDGDGYGDSSMSSMACDASLTTSAMDGDCDDGDDGVNPGAVEVCDAADVDEDCDGLADDLDIASGDASFYYDGDADGHGDPDIATSACDSTATWVASSDDCDDGDAGDYAGAAEITGNGDDEDCDGGEWCYVDADQDGFQPDVPGTIVSSDADCSDAGEALSTTPAGDCDDAVAASSPVGVESCNLTDDDCDGTVDDGVGSTYYLDADNDGYGDAASTMLACSLPTGYAASATDCDDGTALANPGATEVCGDTYDNDCDDDIADCSFDGTYAAATYDVRLTGGVSSDNYGKSLATGDFDGDGDGDLAGGMYYYDVPSSSAGGVTLHYGPLSSSGVATSYDDALLTGSTSSQYFGTSMTAGDHDGDGADDLVVGAYATSSYAGAAYIFYGDTTRRSGTATSTTATDMATITGGTSSDYLGWAVGAGGDMDGDGTDEIVLGAYLQDSGGSSAGAAYLLYGSGTRRSGSAAASTTSATILGGAASDYLGYSVAFVDDMNGDGLDELIVGTYGQDTGASSAGAAYLFLGDVSPLSGSMSASSADVSYFGTTASDYNGYGVYNLTDVTGDGYADAGVHGYGYDGGSISSSGGLFVYAGGTSLSTTAVATLYGQTSSDYLGEEAAGVGDQDGDGKNDLLVGAYGQDTAYSSAGAAYLFYGPVSGSRSATTADAVFYGGTTGDSYFGRRLPDDPSDVTGDGVPDIIVGANWDDSYVYDGGAVYVWAGLGGE